MEKNNNHLKKILIVDALPWNADVVVGTHHYVKYFLQKGHRVFWINSPISIFHVIYYLLKFNVKGKYLKSFLYYWWKNGIKIQDNLIVYSIFTFLPYIKFPFFNTQWTAKYSLKFTFRSINKVLKKWGFSSVDILWIANPRMTYIKDLIKYEKLVYRCSDEFQYFKNIPKSIIKVEQELIESSNIVFYVSKLQFERLKQFNSYFEYLPNGVSIENFIRSNYIFPEEYNTIKQPRIVYLGAIEEWFDVDLVEYIAQNLPAYSFILIGQPNININKLKKLKNIYLLGKKKQECIPNFLKYVQCGIIPLKKTPLTNPLNPLKMYEYLACGLPVVSMDFEGIKKNKTPTYCVSNKFEFKNSIENIIENKIYIKDMNKNIYFAKMNSWEYRFKKVSGLLDV